MKHPDATCDVRLNLSEAESAVATRNFISAPIQALYADLDELEQMVSLLHSMLDGRLPITPHG